MDACATKNCFEWSRLLAPRTTKRYVCFSTEPKIALAVAGYYERTLISKNCWRRLFLPLSVSGFNSIVNRWCDVIISFNIICPFS
jgi:hypothetical protein